MKQRLKDMDELPKWWDMGLNPITGLRPEPQEDRHLTAKRYYIEPGSLGNKIVE